MSTVTSAADPALVGLGLALGIGLIVGLQREWAEDKPVGLRSFALISLLGGLSALTLEQTGGWPVAAGLLALGVVLTAHLWRSSQDGVTTLVAALVVYLVGVAAVAGYWPHAIVVGGTLTVLLQWKGRLHGWVQRLGADDLEIIARFVLIALVILPVLPDRTYGPYDVFNPFEAWLLVVLIVGINLAGYVLLRLFGAGAGGWAVGMLGGLVSSTATTVSYASASREDNSLGPLAALVILVASATVYARVVVELLVVAPTVVPAMLAPAALFTVVLLALGGVVQMRLRRGGRSRLPEQDNPARFRLALGFAALYVLILFALAAARDWVGDDAIYGVAVLSGLTDVDALTLSVGKLAAGGEIDHDTAWRAVFIASLANLTFKVGAASILGSASLRRWIASTGAAAMAAGALLVWLWP